MSACNASLSVNSTSSTTTSTTTKERTMPSQKVECPICGRSVAESNINLHLDLQCPGTTGASSPPPEKESQSQSQGKETHTKLSSQETDEPIPIETPTAASKRPQPRVSRPPASEPRPAPVFGKRPAPGGSINGKGAGSPIVEKKPRVNALTANQPLAERSRPASLDAYVGQSDLVGPGSLLRARIEAGEGVGSCVLWGPPGSGKTTLARLIARTANADFKELSATSAGAADVRLVFEQAKNALKLTGRRTILMVDEIHRFTKPQQDLFLPYVENGWVQLIGATTENPSFKVNGALLSRVFTLSKHTPEDLEQILSNAVAAISDPPRLPPALLLFLADVADGDARQALNGLELALKVCEGTLQTTLDDDDKGKRARRDELLMEAVRKGLRKGYDRSGEERYDMISAMHKSLRGSDGSAAMYWLARMLTGGEDPLYIARRLIVVASEDVGLADNHALPLATATYTACQTIGMPECRINLAHCVAYLAEAPKSTRTYTAYARAEALATKRPLPEVPLQMRNAPTSLMKTLGYGEEYSYNPDYAHPVHNTYLPPTLASHSSHAADGPDRILRTADAEAATKTWNEGALQEWERSVNGGKEWEGRKPS